MSEGVAILKHYCSLMFAEPVLLEKSDAKKLPISAWTIKNMRGNVAD